MNDTEISTIEYNLSGTEKRAVSALERRLAHLCEASRAFATELKKESGIDDIAEAVYTYDGAPELWNKYKTNPQTRGFFAGINAGEGSYFSSVISRYDLLYMCKQLAAMREKPYTPEYIARLLSGEEEKAVSGERGFRIVFIKGKQVNIAFEHFAKSIYDVTPVSAENFNDICESVYSGDAEYGIFPVENSSDGRLGSFYRMMEKYGLFIVMTCVISSQDGESYTKYALCSRFPCGPETGGEKLFHFRVTLVGADGISYLIDAIRYYGAKTKRIDLLPYSVAGRENSFDIIVNTDKADIGGLMCFLMLEYPQFTVVGIYEETEKTETR